MRNHLVISREKAPGVNALYLLDVPSRADMPSVLSTLMH